MLTLSFGSQADLGRIKSVNTALSIRFGGEAFKPLFFRLAGYPLGPEEEYFQCVFHVVISVLWSARLRSLD